MKGVWKSFEIFFDDEDKRAGQEDGKVRAEKLGVAGLYNAGGKNIEKKDDAASEVVVAKTLMAVEQRWDGGVDSGKKFVRGGFGGRQGQRKIALLKLFLVAKNGPGAGGVSGRESWMITDQPGWQARSAVTGKYFAPHAAGMDCILNCVLCAEKSVWVARSLECMSAASSSRHWPEGSRRKSGVQGGTSLVPLWRNWWGPAAPQAAGRRPGVGAYGLPSSSSSCLQFKQREAEESLSAAAECVKVR